jgi:hypothetical protein
LQTVNELRVRLDEQSLEYWINDEKVAEPSKIPLRQGQPVHLGFGSLEGNGVRYSDIKVRQIPPPAKVTYARAAAASSPPLSFNTVVAIVLSVIVTLSFAIVMAARRFGRRKVS